MFVAFRKPAAHRDDDKGASAAPARDEAYAKIKAGGTPPEHMANSLYLEWHSGSGRIVIESADYQLEVSDPAWRFTAEEIA